MSSNSAISPKRTDAATSRARSGWSDPVGTISRLAEFAVILARSSTERFPHFRPHFQNWPISQLQVVFPERCRIQNVVNQTRDRDWPSWPFVGCRKLSAISREFVRSIHQRDCHDWLVSDIISINMPELRLGIKPRIGDRRIGIDSPSLKWGKWW